jgi:hypothetical protein
MPPRTRRLTSSAHQTRLADPRPDRADALTREFDPRRRTAEEKVGKSVKISTNGRELEINDVIGDYAPCIDALHVGSAGWLWVQHAWSRTDQPAGVFETWDLFDSEGRFPRQVSLAVGADSDGDQVFHLGARRVVLIKGFDEQIRIQVGGGNGEGVDEDTPPFEVICCDAEGSCLLVRGRSCGTNGRQVPAAGALPSQMFVVE